MNYRLNRIHTPRTRRAFTLIELLAVIGIISAVAVVIGLALRGGGEGAAISNGQRIAASIFQSARSIASLKQTDTRVIIYSRGSSSNTHDANKQLRFMGVVYRDPDDADTWFPANSGVYLPEGVYYVPQDPKITEFGFVSEVDDDLPTSNMNRVRYESGESDSEFDFAVSYPTFSPDPDDEDRWYFYEFDSRGISKNPGGTFVITAGSRDERAPDDDALLYNIKMDSPFSSAGFAIRKLGGVLIFPDSEDIR